MIFDRVLFAHLLMDRFVCNTLSHVVQRNKRRLQESTVLWPSFLYSQNHFVWLKGKKKKQMCYPLPPPPYLPTSQNNDNDNRVALVGHLSAFLGWTHS